MRVVVLLQVERAICIGRYRAGGSGGGAGTINSICLFSTVGRLAEIHSPLSWLAVEQTGDDKVVDDHDDD